MEEAGKPKEDEKTKKPSFRTNVNLWDGQ